MIIPEKVKILYKNYAVREESNLHDNKSELYGIARYLEEEIVLNAGASLNQKKATLIHEIIHAIDEIYCVELSEGQVEKLGTGVFMLLRDNPDMFIGGDK